MTAPGDSLPAIELRIHGVSGTSVASMLDLGTVHQVAGDDNAGFWRRGEVGDPEITTAHDTVLEGYRWGGLTSGAGKAAAWVFLVPFALVNAAAAAHLPGGSHPKDRDGIAPGVEGVLLRLFALSLSLTFVLTIYISSVDVIGWQCGNRLNPRAPAPFCDRHTAYIRFLSWHFLDSPARRIVVTAFAPLLVLGFVWFLARQSWQRYEAYPVGSAHDLERDERDSTPFDDPGFWNGSERAEVLRRAHVAACLAGISAMLLWARIVIHPQNPSRIAVRTLFAVALVVLGAVVVVAAVPSLPGRRVWAARLQIAAAVVVVVTLVTMWFAELRPTGESPIGPALTRVPAELPGVANVVTVLFVVQLALVMALFVSGWRTKRASRGRVGKIGLNGYASVSLCVIALAIAGAFSSGTVMRVADLFGSPRPHTEIGPVGSRYIVTPDLFTWMARGVLFAAVAIAGLAIVIGVRQYRLSTRLTGTYYTPLTSLFPDAATAKARAAAGEKRTRDVRRTIALAQLTDDAGLVLGPAAVIAFLFAALATAFALAADSNSGWGLLHDAAGNDWRKWTASAGSWLIVGFAGALVVLALDSYRSESDRRLVGILWDVTSFWPRSAHPLAPPCYSERTVPEYAARATFHRYGPLRFDQETQSLAEAGADASQLHRKVVVSAHSQGSIIAAAALLQLRETAGLGFITYGCPLHRLYALYFPAYFGGPTLEVLLRRLVTDATASSAHHGDQHEARWRNLYRETDPIGAWVFAAHDAARALAVHEGGHVDVIVDIPSKLVPGDSAYPPVEGHSRYPREPLYSEKVMELLHLQ